jgi:hypothetical protein
MKLKSLLLGSAAALATSSAFAAEPGAPPVAWDPNDYVLACEGGFIINGTDTCLMISGEYTATFQYQPEGHDHSDFDGADAGSDFGYFINHEYELNFATLTPVESGNVLSKLTLTGEHPSEVEEPDTETITVDPDGIPANGDEFDIEVVAADHEHFDNDDFTVSFAWSKDIEEIDDFENADTGGVLRGFITSSAHVSAWGWLGRQTFDQNGEVDHDEIQMLRYFHEFDKFSLGAAIEEADSGDGLDDIGTDEVPLIFFGGSAWDLGFVDNIDILGVYSDSTYGTVWGGEIDAYWSFGTSDGFIRNGSELSIAVTSVENGFNLVDSDDEGPGQYTMLWGSADLSLGGTAFDLGITGFYRWDPGPTNWLIAVQGEYVINDMWRAALEWNYEGVDPSAAHPTGEFHSVEGRLRYRPMGDEVVEITAAALYEFDTQRVNLDFDIGWNPYDGLLDHNLSLDIEDVTAEIDPSEILVEYEVTHEFGP